MSFKLLQTSAVAAVVGLASINTHASSIWLEPAGTSAITEGDSIAFDLYADASDIVYTYIDPIFGEVTEIGFLAGGIDVFYDINVLTYVGFQFNPTSGTDPAFTRIADDCSVDITAVGCSVPGELNGLGFGAFDGLAGTTTLLGTFTFEGTNAGISAVTMANNDTPAGDWFGVDGELAVVDYTGATVQVNPIPLPAAVWLFGTGLLGLIGVARRRK
jgi:hypothetical protein